MASRDAAGFIAYLIRVGQVRWPGQKSNEELQDMAYAEFLKLMEWEAKGGEHRPLGYWTKCMILREMTRHAKNKEDTVEDIRLYMGTSKPQQLNYVAAIEAIKLVDRLPDKHRIAMLMIADGANPVEISEETGVPLKSVLVVIREARTWLSSGGVYLNAD